MRVLRAVAWLLLAAGALLVGLALARGEVRVGLFLIVPFVYGTGLLAAGGMMLLMAGAIAWFLSLVPPLHAIPPREGEPGSRVERRGGGVVLLGPIPIVWGTDRRVQRWMLVLGAVILALWIVAIALTRR